MDLYWNIAAGLAQVGLGLQSARRNEYFHTREEFFQKRQEDFARLQETYHANTIVLDRKHHQQQLKHSVRQMKEQIYLDLVLEGRERERDMWEQRNTQFQTLVIASTVMLGGGFSLIVEGYLPDTTNYGTTIPEWMIIGYSFTLSFGFLLLFLSIVTSMKVLSLMSTYMYQRASDHATDIKRTLDKLLKVTRELDNQLIEEEQELEDNIEIKDIKDGGTPERNFRQANIKGISHGNQLHQGKDVHEPFVSSSSLSSSLSPSLPTFSKLEMVEEGKKRRSKTSSMTSFFPPSSSSSVSASLPMGQEKQGFSAHNGKERRTEASINIPDANLDDDNMDGNIELRKDNSLGNGKGRKDNFHGGGGSPLLQERRDESGSSKKYRDPLEVYSILATLNKETGEGFCEFWDDHCQAEAVSTKRFFYWGTSFLMVAISILAYARFWKVYSSVISAWIFTVISFVGVLLAIKYHFDFRGKKARAKVKRDTRKRQNSVQNVTNFM